MLVYKDKSDRTKGHKEKTSVTLEDICGVDAGLSYEGMGHTVAIICFSQVVLLGFDSKDIMNAWDVRIRYSLGEGNYIFFPPKNVNLHFPYLKSTNIMMQIGKPTFLDTSVSLVPHCSHWFLLFTSTSLQET